MGKKLLTKMADELVESGLSQVDSVHDRIERGKGVSYLGFEYGDDVFLCRAKEYCYKGLAPFGVEMVEHAVAEGAWLAIYYDDSTSIHVLEAAYVDENGAYKEGRSKRSENRPYLELGLSDGVTLTEFLRGDRPTSLSPDDRALGEFF